MTTTPEQVLATGAEAVSVEPAEAEPASAEPDTPADDDVLLEGFQPL